MSLWARWVRLLDQREDARSLALCRIVIAGGVLHQFVAAWSTHAANAMWVEARYGGVRTLDRLGVLAWFGGASPRNISVMIIAGVVGSILMMLGALGRIGVVMTWLAFRTAAGLNDHSGGSGDDLLVNALFILMFSGCARALSVDARLFRRSRVVPAWPRYVLIGQLVVMYTATGLQKISAGWLPWGRLDALWYILQQPTWQRIPMLWLAPLYRVTQLATLVTWLFETSAPMLLLAFYFRATRERPGRVRALFNRVDYRRVYVGVGLLLHLGIAAAMEVGPFLPGVLGLYACCFHPAEWGRAFERAVRLEPVRALRARVREP